jgi:hypothetical protein
LSRNISCGRLLGKGKDGHVWQSNRNSAVKIHESVPSYRGELDAYIRLRECSVISAAGFSIPRLADFDDNLLALEMTIVSPPFALDFASAILDNPPDLIEDEGHTFYDFIRDRFDEHADEVMDLYHELADRAGIYVLDFHRHNIKFRHEKP